MGRHKLSDDETMRQLQEGRNYKRLYYELKDRFDQEHAENQQLKADMAELKQYFSGIVEAQATRITELETWVKYWAEDLIYWNTITLPPLTSAQPNIPEVLQHLGIKERTSYQIANRAIPYKKSDSQKKRTYREDTLAPLAHTRRTRLQEDGLESTRKIQDYMKIHKLSMVDMIRIGNRLRYDRPIDFLRDNKPLATVILLVRQYEDPDTIGQQMEEIVAMNHRNLPIQCIVWVVPNGTRYSKRNLRLYREYLVARLMVETTNSNIRLLSGIGKASSEASVTAINEEYTRVIALMYWKVAAINSNSQPIYVVNSRNEVLYTGTLMSFLDNQFDMPKMSLAASLQKLNRPRQNKSVSVNDELIATEQLRSRLIMYHTNQKLSYSFRYRIYKSTIRMRLALQKSGLSWLSVDDQHYSSLVHDRRAFDMLTYAQRTAAVLIPYNVDFRYSLASVKLALETLKKANWQSSSHGEIMLVVYGPASIAELHRFRMTMIEAIEAYVKLPESIFLMSTLIRDASVSRLNLQPCEAIIRYEHWLENDMISPKITWFGPKSDYERVPMQYHWYHRNIIGKFVVVRSSSDVSMWPDPTLDFGPALLPFVRSLQTIY